MMDRLNNSRLSDENLSEVVGGNHNNVHGSCPAGAIETKWILDHFPGDRNPKNGCPVCGGSLRDQKFWFAATGELYDGYICNREDSHRWIRV